MAEYQRRLEREGDLVILAGISDQSAPRRWPQLPVQEMGKEDLQVFLTREAYLRDVTWYHLPTRDVWAIDSRCSAAVELSRCYYADGRIRAGRAFFDADYYDDKGVRRVKSADFLGWAKRVLAIGKQICKRDPATELYWGPDAAALRDRAELELLK